MLIRMRTPIVFAGLTLFATGAVHAQPADEFYKRKQTLELIAGAGPGSTYAVWGQVVARYMTKYLPGAPTIVVKAMPGGGGIVAANYLYSVAPKDGSVIGTFSRNLPFQAYLGGEKSISFDPRQFHWLGSVEASVRTCAVLAKAGVRNVNELKQKEVVVGGTGPGSGQSFLPSVVNTLVGTKFKVVDGYRSAEEIHLAIDRGEVSGICGGHDTIVRNQQAKLDSGEMIVLFNLERQRNPALNGVPSIAEFITEPESRQLFAFITSPVEMGRPFVAPPGVPTDRVGALKSAFEQAVADPAFVAETAKLKLELSVTKGEQLAATVDELYATPKPVVEKALKIMPKGGGAD